MAELKKECSGECAESKFIDLGLDKNKYCCKKQLNKAMDDFREDIKK